MLTIGDLLDLGFDPTRLKELTLGNEDYIFERIQAHLIAEIIRKNEILQHLIPLAQQVRIKNARVQTNPALLVIRDRGNAYVLRSKVAGIHWEEAVDQLQSSQSLQALNNSMRLDKLVMATVRKGAEWLRSAVADDGQALVESFTHFVSWNLDTNQPRVVVDFSGTYVETIWIA